MHLFKLCKFFELAKMETKMVSIKKKKKLTLTTNLTDQFYYVQMAQLKIKSGFTVKYCPSLNTKILFKNITHSSDGHCNDRPWF